MYLRVGIKRQPLANERQPVGEVERAKARAWIVARKLYCLAWRRKTEKAFQEIVQRDGPVVNTAPDHTALKSEFQVFSRPEADLFHVDPWVDWIGMARERPDHKVIAEGASNIRKSRNVQRLDSIDAERVDILGIIGVGHACTDSRPQPIVLLSERDLVVQKMA